MAVRSYGFKFNRPNGDNCFGDSSCGLVLGTERVAAEISSWSEFAAAWGEARPAIAAVAFTVALAETRMREVLESAQTPSLEMDLHTRFTKDQLLRAANADTSSPLSGTSRKLFRLAIGMMMSESDRSNAEWLRKLVATSGWPQSPPMRKEAELAAWLMVVHSRHDPAFRFAMIDMMRKMVEQRRMGGARYATRLDHILSETVGLQRYGTKGECTGGRFALTPVEDMNRVPELRRQMGLPTLQEQEEIMRPACSAEASKE